MENENTEITETPKMETNETPIVETPIVETPKKFPKRQPAKKFWISDLLNSEQKLNELGYKCYDVRGKETIRVNIIAIVISIYKNELGNYGMVTIDDGTSQMRLRAWNEDLEMFKDLNLGDVVLTVGRLNLNESNGEIYVRPELLTTVDSQWAQIRQNELKKYYGEAQPVIVKETPLITEEKVIPQEVSEEPVAEVSLSTREKVMQAIESNEGADGAEIAKLITSSGVSEVEAQAAVNELITEGEAFQPKQGFIKLIT